MVHQHPTFALLLHNELLCCAHRITEHTGIHVMSKMVLRVKICSGGCSACERGYRGHCMKSVLVLLVGDNFPIALHAISADSNTYTYLTRRLKSKLRASEKTALQLGSLGT